MGIIGSIFAQNTYTINGSIVDSLRSDKLFYVRVGVVTRDSTMRNIGITFTDAEGNFSLTDIPAGAYNLMAFLVGYSPLTIPIECEGIGSTIELGELRLTK